MRHCRTIAGSTRRKRHLYAGDDHRHQENDGQHYRREHTAQDAAEHRGPVAGSRHDDGRGDRNQHDGGEHEQGEQQGAAEYSRRRVNLWASVAV